MLAFCLPRHSKLDLESSRQLDAAASLAKPKLPFGMDAAASVICWIPNQVWNDDDVAVAS
jgi:hypothetical protein